LYVTLIGSGGSPVGYPRQTQKRKKGKKGKKKQDANLRKWRESVLVCPA